MIRKERNLFYVLLIIAVLTDCVRGYCQELINYGYVQMEWSDLYCLLDSITMFLYVSVITYILYVFSHKGIAEFIVYSVFSGCWLPMAIIDMWQEINRNNTTYEVHELEIFIASIAISFIAGLWRWNKKKNLPKQHYE